MKLCIDWLCNQKIRYAYSPCVGVGIPCFSLKGNAALILSIFYKKELLKPWILISVSSKSGEKWGSYGRLKNSVWPTLSRHLNI